VALWRPGLQRGPLRRRQRQGHRAQGGRAGFDAGGLQPLCRTALYGACLRRRMARGPVGRAAVCGRSRRRAHWSHDRLSLAHDRR